MALSNFTCSVNLENQSFLLQQPTQSKASDSFQASFLHNLTGAGNTLGFPMQVGGHLTHSTQDQQAKVIPSALHPLFSTLYPFQPWIGLSRNFSSPSQPYTLWQNQQSLDTREKTSACASSFRPWEKNYHVPLPKVNNEGNTEASTSHPVISSTSNEHYEASYHNDLLHQHSPGE